MVDSSKVMASLIGTSRTSVMKAKLAALTPNLQGYEAARAAKVDEVAVFASASESFSRANINCDIAESLQRFEPLMQRARVDGVPVRGYVSCVLGCPYEGWIAPQQVLDVAQQLLKMGCYEISLGDTIGVGTSGLTSALLRHLTPHLPVAQLAVHFHDTYGQALANIRTALSHGISVVDSSVAGLGGCPYAAGATGNVATEDVIYMLHGTGIETGCDLVEVVKTAKWINEQLKRAPQSKLARAFSSV